MFRDVAAIGSAYKISRCHHQLASLGTVYDMVIDPTMEIAVTVGQVNSILKVIQVSKNYRNGALEGLLQLTSSATS